MYSPTGVHTSPSNGGITYGDSIKIREKGINPIINKVLKVFKNKVLQSSPLLFCSENSCLNTSLTEEVTNQIGEPNTFSDKVKYPADVLPNPLFNSTFGDEEANTDKLSENKEYWSL